ncbi:MAG: hypothetical protein ACRDUX_25130 [Mycobacterium sp.]
MTADILSKIATTHPDITAWVDDVAGLTTPDQIVWCDGSDDEWRTLTGLLVNSGTFVRPPRKPNSFWCASDPEDVARVEDREIRSTPIRSRFPRDRFHLCRRPDMVGLWWTRTGTASQIGMQRWCVTVPQCTGSPSTSSYRRFR